LFGAIAGAALGAYLQELWASEPAGEDEEELLRRLDKLEAEIEKLELRRRERRSKVELTPSTQGTRSEAPPRPVLEVRGKPPEQQYLVLSANRDFRLSRIDYVSSQGTTIISEDVEKSGRRIEVPINEKKVSRIWYLRQNVSAAPTPFQFRCHLSVDGVETESEVPAVIQQKYMRIGDARTIFRNVTLSR
jgi:hypothetical protein